MHLTSRVKLECELGWSSIKNRTVFLGLMLFQKIHCNQLRPLIKSCMPKFSPRIANAVQAAYKATTCPIFQLQRQNTKIFQKDVAKNV